MKTLISTATLVAITLSFVSPFASASDKQRLEASMKVVHSELDPAEVEFDEGVIVLESLIVMGAAAGTFANHEKVRILDAAKDPFKAAIATDELVDFNRATTRAHKAYERVYLAYKGPKPGTMAAKEAAINEFRAAKKEQKLLGEKLTKKYNLKAAMIKDQNAFVQGVRKNAKIHAALMAVTGAAIGIDAVLRAGRLFKLGEESMGATYMPAEVIDEYNLAKRIAAKQGTKERDTIAPAKASALRGN